jgi:cysteine synthase
LKYLGEGAIVPGIFNMGFSDERLFVSTEFANDMAKRLAREECMFVGRSSGAALAPALSIVGNLEEGTTVTMFPARGGRY